jgi:signal transduction histidine kinase
LYNANEYKEKEYRKLVALQLSSERDPLTEFKFDEVSSAILHDTILTDLLGENLRISQEDASSYIKLNHFKGFWLKYDILVTICDSTKLLDIQAEDVMVDCFHYFEHSVEEFGVRTDCQNFYYLDYNFTDDHYIGIIDFSEKQIPIKVFVEIFPKNIPKGLGYPELLMDQQTTSSINWSVYSYVRYENNELAYRYGKFFYSMFLDEQLLQMASNRFFNHEGYSHLYYQVNQSTVLIISKKRPSLLEIIAPFSYISIFYGLLIFLIYIIIKSPVNLKISSLGLKKRLQLSVTMLIIVSFLFVGVGSLFYIISLNTNKNSSILSEKTHSVLVELEHKLAGEPFLNHEMELYLSDLLYKFSLVFFSDINMYDLNGTLLATSRPEIFNEGLKSAKMNPQAYFNLIISKKSLYIHEEKIGDYKYLSAYIPFRNEQNKLIAYLNLPYFAKQDELTNEVSTFMVAFININVILIAIAIFISLIVSNYITKPVQLIKEKISRLRLGKTDEKIEWNRMDEIGGLVKEYNRMVDELAKSAELLAKSERESAWRQMAQQVAHEIKNPLTPMKLSVQYLQKAWNEKSPDWEDRLNRFTQTIIEQIDSLSVIASEFSNFANMPRLFMKPADIVEIINSSIDLFSKTTTIQFTFENQQPRIVMVDREQMLRVFNNLIKNSIQAIPNPVDGIVEITIEKINSTFLIVFSDNGVGIPDDQKEKVFYPNFTTKSSGTGLGLAMVKSIVENAGGSISFKSEEGHGTSFYISLPEHNG